MKAIAMIIMVSIVLEALVEYVKTVMHMLEEGEYKTAITQGITVVLGIFLAFAFHLQLFNEGMSEIYEGLSINPVIDTVLTGILFSRGSNYFSDLIGRLSHKEAEEDMDFDDEYIIKEGDDDGITEDEDED